MTATSELASAVKSAYMSTPISPLRERASDLSVEAAYAIQESNTCAWLGEGRKLIGRKIGLTSEAVQKQLGVDQPDYGMLWADSFYKSGQEIKRSDFLQPRAEAEIAFMLKADLTQDVTMEQLIAAIDYATTAIEIVDSRIADWNIRLFDTIADNASYGAIVMGDAKVKLSDCDLEGCKMVMTENGEVVSEGVGAACLGNPLNAALWLAQKMIETGRPLMAGDIILSGAVGPMVDAKAGAVYDAKIEGLGSAIFKFTGEPA